jgi:hypothetical protein
LPLWAVATQGGELPWGASTNGLRVGIDHNDDDKTLTVRFRNDGGEPLHVVTDSLWYHCDLFVDDKRVVRQDDFDDMILAGLSADSFKRIEAGKVLTCTLPLSRWAQLPSGILRLRYRNTELMRQKNDGKEFGLKVWMGVAESNSIKIKAANKAPEDTARKLADPQR